MITSKLYIYIYIYIYIYTYIYIYVCMYVFIFLHTYTLEFLLYVSMSSYINEHVNFEFPQEG